jgi:capsular exopolysaccharide synthesis family protein
MDGQTAPAHTYYYPDYAVDSGGDAPSINLARIGRQLWNRKWWIAAATALGAAGGWIASTFVAPQYVVSTSLSVEGGGTGRSGPIQTGQILPALGWTDVFVSRAVLGPVVDSLGLQLRVLSASHRPAFASFETTADAIPGDYTLSVRAGGDWTLGRAGTEGSLEHGGRGDLVGSSSGFRWTPDFSGVEPGTELRFRVLDRGGAVGALAGRLDKGVRGQTGIIWATLTWPDPYEAADILNAVTTRFVSLSEDLTTTKIRETVDLVRTQSDLTGQLLLNAEFALQAQRVDAITEPTEPMMSPVTPAGPAGGDPLFTTFAQNKLRADQLALELEQIQAIGNDLAAGRELNMLALQYLPSASQAGELQSALQALQNVRVDRRTLLYTYTEEEPQVQAKTEQVRQLEREIVPGLLGRLSDEIRNQMGLLNNQIANQGQQLREIPSRTIQTARLQREVAQAASLHTVLLGRLKEAELAAATAGPGISVIDPAWPNAQAGGERPSTVIVIFTGLAFGLGVAGVLVFDRLDRRIHSPEQVTGILGLPVLAVVPRLQATPDPASPTAAIAVESFRGLRTQIAHVDGIPGGVTLITSPAPREGKSMVSANLAISYATAGYRTVLLDGDTRRGRAQEMFNLARAPGLTDFLMDRATLEDVVQVTSVENLTLIARGAPGGFNADLLEGRRMVSLMETLRADYDVVVMDGPPLAAGADVMLLGNLADKVVVVLRAGSTTEDLAKAKLGTLGNVDLPIVGAVLNALPKSAPEYEYYVHYYYADAEAV